nr:ABC transporter permease subunit [Sedimentibacter sp.]
MKKAVGFLNKYWGTLLLIAGFLLFYTYATNNSIIDAFLFPTPQKIGSAFVRNFKTLLTGMLHSFKLLFPGLTIGTIIALLVGIPMGLKKGIRRNLHPIVYSISVIPLVLLTPFFINLCPTFSLASMCLVIYGSIWSTLFATITGIQTIDKRYLDNAAVLEVRGVEKMFRVLLPAAMPSILAGFINSVRIAFLALVFAEMFGAKYGMGYFVQYYYTLGKFDNVMAGMIFLITILIIVMQIFDRIKNRLLKWTIN